MDWWPPVSVTVALASITTLILVMLATPLAWWLARSESPWRAVVEAIVALPLVLPPTVLGFYFLVALNPHTLVGSWWLAVTGTTLTFSFTGLVVGSLVYSLPFMVQPLRTAFAAIPQSLLEASATLGASPVDRFWSLIIPMSWRGYIAAAVLTFAHTVGEFGVVLMIGGNLPGKTQVLSIAIYEHVEQLRYPEAHQLSLALLIFALVVLSFVYRLQRRAPGRLLSP
jgi:molybdate transport system permease protein